MFYLGERDVNNKDRPGRSGAFSLLNSYLISCYKVYSLPLKYKDKHLN